MKICLWAEINILKKDIEVNHSKPSPFFAGGLVL